MGSDENAYTHHIYFIQSTEGDQLIKIGSARRGRYRHRLKEIQTLSPVPLRLLALIDGDIKYERELHRRFHRLRKHGEWFWPGADLTWFLEGIGAKKEEWCWSEVVDPARNPQKFKKPPLVSERPPLGSPPPPGRRHATINGGLNCTE